MYVYSGTSDSGHSEERTTPYNGQTACPLPTTVCMLEPPKRRQPPNNVQNTRPQRVHCLEVPLYITMKRYCYFTPVIAVENDYVKDFGFTVVNALYILSPPQLSKGYKDTVLQGTYNSTLNNPLISASSTDRHSPERTTNKKQNLIVQA